jgi:hypothetical protein
MPPEVPALPRDQAIALLVGSYTLVLSLVWFAAGYWHFRFRPAELGGVVYEEETDDPAEVALPGEIMHDPAMALNFFELEDGRRLHVNRVDATAPVPGFVVRDRRTQTRFPELPKGVTRKQVRDWIIHFQDHKQDRQYGFTVTGIKTMLQPPPWADDRTRVGGVKQWLAERGWIYIKGNDQYEVTGLGAFVFDAIGTGQLTLEECVFTTLPSLPLPADEE